MDLRRLLLDGFRAAVAAADPLQVLAPALPDPASIRRVRRTLAVGAGKAAASMAMAVELMAIARPTTTASAQTKPTTRASTAITMLVASICVKPRPKTLLRMRQSSLPSTSRPMRKSIMTMPKSAIWWMSWVSETSDRP